MLFLASLLFQEGATPLILATQSGHIDAVQYLIYCGADINLISDTLNTALWTAVSYAIIAQNNADTEKSSVYEKIVLLLISEGADTTTLDHSVYHSRYGHNSNYPYRNYLTQKIEVNLSLNLPL